jgi:hypothetical protein
LLHVLVRESGGAPANRLSLHSLTNHEKPSGAHACSELLKEELGDDDALAERVRREARKASKFAHPNTSAWSISVSCATVDRTS